MKNVKNYLLALALPLLFGLFPLLFLYAQNAEEMVIHDLIIPLLLVVGFALVVTTLFGFIMKSFVKSALIAALFLFSFFSYGHILRILPDFQVALAGIIYRTGHFLLFFWVAAIIPLIIIIIKNKRGMGRNKVCKDKLW